MIVIYRLFYVFYFYVILFNVYLKGSKFNLRNKCELVYNIIIFEKKVKFEKIRF
jgi:hypothetical protein